VSARARDLTPPKSDRASLPKNTPCCPKVGVVSNTTSVELVEQ
jgi:hypothetical protein